MNKERLMERIQEKTGFSEVESKTLYEMLKLIYSKRHYSFTHFARTDVLIWCEHLGRDADLNPLLDKLIVSKIIIQSGSQLRLNKLFFDYIEEVEHPESVLEEHVEYVQPIAKYLASVLLQRKRGVTFKQLQKIQKNLWSAEMAPHSKAFEENVGKTIDKLITQMIKDHFIRTSKSGKRTRTRYYWQQHYGKRLTGEQEEEDG